MLVLMTLILTVAGVVLLRPLAKRLGDLLELMVEQRRSSLGGEEAAPTRELVETLSARTALLEERQDFTDSLLPAPREPTSLADLARSRPAAEREPLA